MRTGYLAIVSLLCAGCLFGCSGQASVNAKDQSSYADRNPADIHGPPAGFTPPGPPSQAKGPAGQGAKLGG